MNKRVLIPMLALLLSALLTISAAGALLSPGLRVISSRISMKKCGVSGEPISFSPEDFDKMLGVKVASVTVSSLPPINEGELTLNGIPVVRNQTIERSKLASLLFTAHGNAVRESSMRFTYNASGWEYDIPCTLYLPEEENSAPTVTLLGQSARTIVTYRETDCCGTLRAIDPENDSMTFRVTSYPQHGTLTLLSAESGAYLYSPDEKFTGKDAFRYEACDQYGNASEIAEVNITVKTSPQAINYSDMDRHWACAAALAMTEMGIMSGTNGAFLPNDAVSRSEFLTMAMTAAGYEVRGSRATVFRDNSEIPQKDLGYVAAAYDLGFIHGSDNGSGMLCFRPNDEITRAEAAVILTAVFSLDETKLKPVFADASEIPAWAERDLNTLYAAGVINGTGSGKIEPSALLTRAQAAQMLLLLTMI